VAIRPAIWRRSGRRSGVITVGTIGVITAGDPTHRAHNPAANALAPR
jgi:hypothetical protein